MARKSSLSGLSFEDLQREMRKRQRKIGPLMKRRASTAAKLARLDAEIAALGGTPGSARGARVGGRTRPRNATNLVEALKKVLTDKTMSVTDVGEAVQKAGYKTTSPFFRTIVNQTLIKYKNVFKRVGRGQYTAK